MKYLGLLFAALFFLSACTNEKEKLEGLDYIVDGKIEGAEGQTLFLDQMSLQGNVPIDTAILNKEGEFKMKGTLPEDGLYMLRFNQNKTWALVLEGGAVTVNGNFEDVFDYTVSGSQPSEQLSAFIKELGTTQKSLQQLTQQFQQLRAQGGDQNQLMQIQMQYQQKAGYLQKLTTNFVDTVQSPHLALFGASLLDVRENTALLKKVVERVEDQVPNSPFLADFKAKLKEAKRLAIGSKAPDFKLKSHKGTEYSLYDMDAKYILIDFWASWCRPCRIENPNLVKTYKEYKDKGFEIYSISLDKNMQKWVSAIGQDNLTWKYHGSELKGWQCPVAQNYNVRSIPATFLVDGEFNIVAKNLRGDALENKLAELLD
ncbi:MAG: TlpA disulfide reductase family protein [Chitinophagales bacterium]